MVRNWFASEKGRRVWEGTILRLPLVGPLVAQFAMARFTRMLGTLLGAGVPLINALNVARRSIGNQILVDAVSNSIDRVKEGKPLGTSLGRNQGAVSRSHHRDDFRRRGKRPAGPGVGPDRRRDRGRSRPAAQDAVALAEPLMLFLIAGFIGTIFIGMVCQSSPCTDTSNNPHTIMKNISRTFTRVRREQRAFTLVELLLVLVILGTLAAIVLPKFSGVSQRGRVTAAATQISTFKTALDAFEVDMGYYPKGRNGLVDLI